MFGMTMDKFTYIDSFNWLCYDELNISRKQGPHEQSFNIILDFKCSLSQNNSLIHVEECYRIKGYSYC